MRGMETPRDPKFSAWIRAAYPVGLGPIAKPSHKKIRAASEAFFSNVHMALSLARLVQAAFDAGRNFGYAHLYAHHLTVGIDAPFPVGRFSGSKFHDLLHELLEKNDVPDRVRLLPLRWKDELAHEMIKGEMANQMEAVMLAQLVFIWTAFESLVGDLWEASADAIPRKFLEKHEQFKDKRKRNGISVSQGYGQNIGSELRRVLNFNSLDSIARIYSHYFTKDSRGRGIAKTFDDAHLLALFAVRNVIVHKAAKIDRFYLERVVHFKPLRSS
jgi:hypothetical protein